MAVALNPRAERLLARARRVSVYSALELLLLVLVAVQCARLFWAFLTPIGPIGDFRALDLVRPGPPAGQTLGAFDPFFRQTPGAAPGPSPMVVTALDIRLFGITENRATGGGSAIIGTADGPQRSFQVGEEIMPGVVLTGVAFDHVTVTRSGAPEQLFLDQSPAVPAPAGQTTPGTMPAPPPAMEQRPIGVPTVRVPAPPAPAPGTLNTQTMRVNQ